MNQTITLAPGDTLTVIGGSAGSTTTPPVVQPPVVTQPPVQSPAGTSNYEMDWANPRRITTSGVDQDTLVAVKFTTGGISSSNNLPHFNIVEGNSSPRWPRTNWLSETPGGASIGRESEGEVKFALGTGSGMGYYSVLELNKTYWLNIKAKPGASGPCDVDIDLIKGAL